MSKFFEDIYDAVKKHINFDIVRVVMVGRLIIYSQILLRTCLVQDS